MNKLYGTTPETQHATHNEKEKTDKQPNYFARRAGAAGLAATILIGGGAAVHELTQTPVEIASSTSTIGQGEGIQSAVESAADSIQDVTGLNLSSGEVMDAISTTEADMQRENHTIDPGTRIEVTVYKGPFGHIDAVGSLADSDEK